MNQGKRNEIIILALCLLIGFALRFYTFDQKSLWVDEVHTYNDSRDDFTNQIKFYKENPTFLHPPLFFILTHLFYPFEKPERDLRIIPLIFGTLSIPMIYLLARRLSRNIGLPCAISLTLMTYHISLSQDGRSYSMLLFFGIAGLYFFLKHLQTSKRRYLPLIAIFFAILFHTSYSSILFIIFSQFLWFHTPNQEFRKSPLASFLILNGLTLLFCLPWILFAITNYKGQTIMDPLHGDPGTFLNIITNIVNDWASRTPLMLISFFLIILFPLFSPDKKMAFILLAIFIFPVGGLYFFCRLFNIAHFVTSRYFINFLPFFLIILFLSIDAIEIKFFNLRRFLRPKLLFLFFFIASNFILLPLYYHSEKQNFRGLVNYLNGHLQESDTIFVQSIAYIPAILYYFGTIPKGRHYTIPYEFKDSGKQIEFKKPFVHKNINYTLYSSNICCAQYLSGNNRLWIVHGKEGAKQFSEKNPVVVKGYFDGRFASFRKFPSDASMYLFLWDPSSPDEKGIDLPID